MLKLAILGVALVIGGFFLYPEFVKIIPTDNPTINAVAQSVDDLKDTTMKRVNYEMDKTLDKAGEKIEETIPEPAEVNPVNRIKEKIAVPKTEAVYYGEVYDTDEEGNCKISVPKMARTINEVQELTHTITVPNCKYERHQSVQVTTTTDPNTNEQSVSVGPTPQSQLFETLQLKTMRTSDKSVSLHYEDSSGKTQKVTVTLRNAEKQLFSGEFFSSKFDTSVDDVSSSPHIIEMVVEHADYGTVSSSVYDPVGNDETTIYGVFTKN